MNLKQRSTLSDCLIETTFIKRRQRETELAKRVPFPLFYFSNHTNTQVYGYIGC